MKDKKITIIGLGLIGGSLARALRERMGISDITAVGRNMQPLQQAVLDGTISRCFNDLNEYVYNSDIVFICTPVKKALDYIDSLAGKIKPGCIITDVGSTKSEIVEYINKMEQPPCFIGGHPMAGTEKTGYAAGFSHLFENAYYILTPAKSTTCDAVDTLTAIIKGIGGIPVLLDCEEHDRVTGCISHIPHIIASALVNMVKEQDSPDKKMQMLAAGGFKDITRIASSSPEMWENIVMSNKKQIGGILDVYVELIEKFKRYMENDDANGIYGFFESSRDYRNSFSNIKKGLINPVYEIVVDVVDKPGIIGKIATILGNNGVNIKNINVSNNREFEQGCLRITLPDTAGQETAYRLLVESGYRAYKGS